VYTEVIYLVKGSKTFKLDITMKFKIRTEQRVRPNFEDNDDVSPLHSPPTRSFNLGHVSDSDQEGESTEESYFALEQKSNPPKKQKKKKKKNAKKKIETKLKKMVKKVPRKLVPYNRFSPITNVAKGYILRWLVFIGVAIGMLVFLTQGGTELIGKTVLTRVVKDSILNSKIATKVKERLSLMDRLDAIQIRINEMNRDWDAYVQVVKGLSESRTDFRNTLGNYKETNVNITFQIDRFIDLARTYISLQYQYFDEIDRRGALRVTLQQQVEHYNELWEEKYEFVEEINLQTEYQKNTTAQSSAALVVYTGSVDALLVEGRRAHERAVWFNKTIEEALELIFYTKQVAQETHNVTIYLNNTRDGLLVVTHDLKDVAELMDYSLEQQQIATQDRQVVVNELILTNNEMEVNHHNLSSSIDRLSSAGSDFGDTYKEIIDGIKRYNSEFHYTRLQLKRVHIQTDMATWRTGVNTQFLDTWVEDTSMSIGSYEYDKVVALIWVDILNELCVNKTTFEDYLAETRYPFLSNPYDITMKMLHVAVEEYIAAKIDYLFPKKKGLPGISAVEWELARYDCYLLEPEYMFNITEHVDLN
jgi:hypothetical protein